jgi:hypothetical protein
LPALFLKQRIKAEKSVKLALQILLTRNGGSANEQPEQKSESAE